MIYSKRKGNVYTNDYTQEVDAQASLCMTQFSDLSIVDKDDLIAMWLDDDSNSDEKVEIVLDWVRRYIPEYIAEDVFVEFCSSQALSEMMFGSSLFSKINVGYLLDRSLYGGLSSSVDNVSDCIDSLILELRTGRHTHKINEDIKEAYIDYIESVDEDYCDESFDKDRSVGLDKVKHQRMGI